MSDDFKPLAQPSGAGVTPPPNTADRRTAHAAEFSAHQLGQINKKMDHLIEAIEKLSARL
jgi:hypothetical protein